MISSYIKWAVGIIILVSLLFLAVRFGGSQLVPSLTGTESDTVEVAKDTALVGKRAPYFDLPDATGTHIKSSDFSDAPLVVVFWATWNQDAADQMKILDDYLAHTSGERLVQIIAIDSQEERSIFASFMRRGGYQVRSVVDARGATSEEYQVKGLPTSFFIDKDGTIRERYSGILSERALVDKIENLLR